MCVFIIVWIMSNSSALYWYHKDSRMVANFLIKLYYGENNSFKSRNKSLVIKAIHTFYGTCFNSYSRSCPFVWQKCLNCKTNKHLIKVSCLWYQELWIYKFDMFNRITQNRNIYNTNFLKVFCSRSVSSYRKHNRNILIQLTLYL